MAIKTSSLLEKYTQVQSDTTPQLGGNLDTNGFAISNGSLPVIITGNKYPILQGSPNNVLITDGLGNLSFASSPIPTISLTGDVVGSSGSGTIATALKTSGVTANTYGSASATSSFAVNAKGIITTASSVSISITPSQAGLGNVSNSPQVINAGGVPGIIAGDGAPSGSQSSGFLYVDDATTNGKGIYRYNGAAWSIVSSKIVLLTENLSAPVLPVASGANAVAIGSSSSALAQDSIAIGPGSKSYIYGQKTIANGQFTSPGDAQQGTYVMRCITTDATPSELFLNGSGATERLVMPNNSVFVFTITVAARRTDAVNGAAGYKFEGIAKRDNDASTISFVGVPSKTILGEINTEWNVILSTDPTFGSIKISSTGEVGKTIRWVATIMTTEVTN